MCEQKDKQKTSNVDIDILAEMTFDLVMAGVFFVGVLLVSLAYQSIKASADSVPPTSTDPVSRSRNTSALPSVLLY